MVNKLINLIVARGKNGEIGKDGKIPWNIKDDMAYFRKITTLTNDQNKQNAILMGRLTFESIGRCLPNRVNIVLSKKPQENNGDEKYFYSIEEAIGWCFSNEKIENIFVIGGESIYRSCMKWADFIYLTSIEKEYENCDTFFFFDENEFSTVSSTETVAEGRPNLTFSVLRRTSPNHGFNSNNHNTSYSILLNKVLDNGLLKSNRTGVDTLSIFGAQAVYDLKYGFPLLTTKRIYFKGVVAELLWFLKGDTNIKYLNENNVKIWDAWADENGDLGPIYGKQWVKWGGNINQIEKVIETLKSDPDSRRMVVSALNVADLDKMALHPCHYSFQFNTRPITLNDENWKEFRGLLGVNAQNPERIVDLMFNMRSNDLFLGHPFNIASYALLLQMVAQCVNMIPGKVIFNGADVHIYKNHVEQTKLLLSRDCDKFPHPWVSLNSKIDNIFDFDFDDIKLNDYESFPSIRAEIAV